MSKGVEEKAIKAFEDENIFVYNYGAYNLNIPKYKELIVDGVFTIKKEDIEKVLMMFK